MSVLTSLSLALCYPLRDLKSRVWKLVRLSFVILTAVGMAGCALAKPAPSPIEIGALVSEDPIPVPDPEPQPEPDEEWVKELIKHIPAPGMAGVLPGSIVQDNVLIGGNEFPFCSEIHCYKSDMAFYVWSGMALNSKTGHWRLLASGGHNDGGINNIYNFDFARNEWSRLTNPAPLDGPPTVDKDGDGIKDHCPNPIGTPAATHAYDAAIYVPVTDEWFLSGMVPFCSGAMQSQQNAWVYNDDAGWRQLDFTINYGRTAYDPQRKKIIAFRQKPMMLLEIDPLNNYSVKQLFNPRLPDIGDGLGHFDAERRYFYVSGRSGLYRFKVSATGVYSAVETVSLNTYRFYAIHEPTGNVVFLDGFKTPKIWHLNVTTKVISEVTPLSGYQVPFGSGEKTAYSMRYIPEADVFVWMSKPELGIQMFRLPSGEIKPRPPTDFGPMDPPVPPHGASATTIYHETFESNDWWKNWVSGVATSRHIAIKPANISHVEMMDSGCVIGRCIKIHVPAFNCCGVSIHYPIAGNKDNITLEYRIKFASNWDSQLYYNDTHLPHIQSGGKLPGLGDIDQWPDEQCGNGGAKSDGLNCWSNRLTFKSCDSACADNEVRIGNYPYRPEPVTNHGDSAYFDDHISYQTGNNIDTCATSNRNMFCGKGKGGLKKGVWHKVRVQIAMNQVGHKNGVLRAWVNDELRYEKTNALWRSPGHENLHVRHVWMNLAFGGSGVGPKESTYLMIDDLKVIGD